MKIVALYYSCNRVLSFLPKFYFWLVLFLSHVFVLHLVSFLFSVVIPFEQFLTIFFVKMIELVVRKPGNSNTTKRITQKENNYNLTHLPSSLFVLKPLH